MTFLLLISILFGSRGGNGRLLYSGVQDQYYTYTMFDVCGLFAVKVMLGEIPLPSPDQMNR